MAEPVDNAHLPRADIGNNGGGLLMGNSSAPASADYEAIFGPSGRDIKRDEQRSKRHQRWHLPDMLKGPNPFLTDRVDGLITDATNSPFTTIILPYVFLPNPDAKIKWNVYSFDEGLATRVPYESGARVLTQSKSSHAGYAVRQGLAITMEHNFMMSPAGRENFNNQLLQLVGSIQYTNDLDVHMALITAPSYERTMAEKYQFMDKDPNQVIRQYVDMFGIMQKNPNGLDIIIEESKQNLKKWGAKEPTFMLVNGRLCMQLNMNIERTQYMTNGYDGVKRLRAGPDMPKYRNLDVVNSRSFSLETGAPPRDLLNRRVRVAEYYHIPMQTAKTLTHDDGYVEVYDEGRDQMRKISMSHILKHAELPHHPLNLEVNTDFLNLLQADQRCQFKLHLKTLRRNGADSMTTAEYMRAVAHTNINRDDVGTLQFWDYILVCLQLAQNGAFPIADLGQPVTISNALHRDNRAALLTQVDWGVETFTHLMGRIYDHFNVTAERRVQINNAFSRLRTMWSAILDSNEGVVYMTHAMMPNSISPWYLLSNIKAVLADLARVTCGTQAYARFTGQHNIYPVHRNAVCDILNRDHYIFFRDSMGAVPTGLYPEVARLLAAAGLEKMYEIVMVRPCIEHEMLGIVLGRGGTQELGCTFWGQTELSCYDDAFHGKWGMSYKYHERAIVHNEKNLIRLWDVCFNGYTGGMGTKLVSWRDEGNKLGEFKEHAQNTSEPFGNADDIMCMIFEVATDAHGNCNQSEMPNPVKFHGLPADAARVDPDNIFTLQTDEQNVLFTGHYRERFEWYKALMPNFTSLHMQRKNAGMASVESDTHQDSLAFQGTMNLFLPGIQPQMFRGTGHLGDAYVGCASVRAGKGMQTVMGNGGMNLNRIV
jgi:hypothetical protein